MRACDVAVNLRHPTGGETSASLLRLLATGVPTIVTDTGSFAELPAGVAAKLPIDESETDLLFELLARLAADGELRTGLSRAARAHVRAEHSLARSASAYAAAVARLATQSPPAAPVPPLAADSGHDPRVEIAAALGAAVVDLGRDDRDGELLAELAATLAELGWSPGRGRDPAVRKRQAIAIGLAAGAAAALVAHGIYWYLPRERAAEASAGARARLEDPAWEVVAWVPYPHQNLGLLESRVGDLRQWLALVAPPGVRRSIACRTSGRGSFRRPAS
jgi:hypothetical protein